MNRRRGRPKGKKFPSPRTEAEGFDIAIYGKIGASEAMSIIRDCPYPTIEFIKKIPPKHRGDANKKLLKWAPKFAESWLRRVGPILGQKITAGDGEFFRELAIAVEELSKRNRQIENLRRYLALQCKIGCEAHAVPFTSKELRDYYKRHNPGDDIDSSTLSKMVNWARAAKLSDEDLIQLFGPPRIQRPENRIL